MSYAQHPDAKAEADGRWDQYPEVVPQEHDSGGLPEARAGWTKHEATEKIVYVGEQQQAKSDLYPSLVSPGTTKKYYMNQDHQGLQVQDHQGLQAQDHEGLQVPNYEGHEVQPRAVPWWKRRKSRKWLITGGVAVIIVIVAGSVGGALASKKKSSSNDPSSLGAGSPTGTAAALLGTPTVFPTDLPPSPCGDTMCAPAVAAAQFSTPETVSSFVFARGTDDAMYYRQANSTAWQPTNEGGNGNGNGGGEEWGYLGTIGNTEFISAPAAVSVRNGAVRVFGIGGVDGRARSRGFEDGAWEDSWTDLAGDCAGPLTTTSFGRDRLSMFCVSSEGYLDLKYRREDTWGPGGNAAGDWQNLGGAGMLVRGELGGGAVALDSGGDERVDAVGYWKGNDGTTSHMCFMRYVDDGSDWSAWEDCWGDFKGDPAIVSVGTSHSEAFGIWSNGEMWQIAWDKKVRRVNGTAEPVTEDTIPPVVGTVAPREHPDEYSTPLNLGGKFGSSPAVLVTDDGRRVDVVAVGAEDGNGGAGRLFHRARIDGDWSGDWEDLGGYYTSAPTILAIDNFKTVAVFGIGPDGRIIHGLFTIGDSFSWDGGVWFTDGGDFTSEVYRANVL